MNFSCFFNVSQRHSRELAFLRLWQLSINTFDFIEMLIFLYVRLLMFFAYISPLYSNFTHCFIKSSLLFISCGYQFALSLFCAFSEPFFLVRKNIYGSFSYSSFKSFSKVPNYEQLSLLWALHTKLQNNSSSQFYWSMLIGLIWITMRFTIMHSKWASYIFISWNACDDHEKKKHFT